MALKNVRKLVIRLVLSVGFAFLISRLFFQGMATVKVLGFALALCGLAYVFEVLRKQN